MLRYEQMLLVHVQASLSYVAELADAASCESSSLNLNELYVHGLVRFFIDLFHLPKKKCYSYIIQLKHFCYDDHTM